MRATCKQCGTAHARWHISVHSLDAGCADSLGMLPSQQFDRKEDRHPRWPQVPDWCVPPKQEWGSEVGNAIGARQHWLPV